MFSLSVTITAVMDQISASSGAGGLRGTLVQDRTDCREAFLRTLATRRCRGHIHGSS